MIDATVLLGSSDHSFASLGIVHAADRALEHSRFLVDGYDSKRRVPIVDREHVLLRLVDGEIARGCAAGVDRLPERFETAISFDLVGEDLSVLGAVFGASVHYVEARVVPRKGRVDDGLGIALDVEQDEGSIAGMEAVDVERLLGLGSAGAMGCLSCGQMSSGWTMEKKEMERPGRLAREAREAREERESPKGG